MFECFTIAPTLETGLVSGSSALDNLTLTLRQDVTMDMGNSATTCVKFFEEEPDYSEVRTFFSCLVSSLSLLKNLIAAEKPYC